MNAIKTKMCQPQLLEFSRTLCQETAFWDLNQLMVTSSAEKTGTPLNLVVQEMEMSHQARLEASVANLFGGHVLTIANAAQELAESSESAFWDQYMEQDARKSLEEKSGAWEYLVGHLLAEQYNASPFLPSVLPTRSAALDGALM